MASAFPDCSFTRGRRRDLGGVGRELVEIGYYWRPTVWIEYPLVHLPVSWRCSWADGHIRGIEHISLPSYIPPLRLDGHSTQGAQTPKGGIGGPNSIRAAYS